MYKDCRMVFIHSYYYIHIFFFWKKSELLHTVWCTSRSTFFFSFFLFFFMKNCIIQIINTQHSKGYLERKHWLSFSAWLYLQHSLQSCFCFFEIWTSDNRVLTWKHSNIKQIKKESMNSASCLHTSHSSLPYTLNYIQGSARWGWGWGGSLGGG